MPPRWLSSLSPGRSQRSQEPSPAREAGPSSAREGESRDENQEKLGLFTLFKPPENRPITVDIVAVHGLLDDPYGAWQEGDKLWLRDPGFLPSMIPSARILSYGYNSSVALSQTFSGPKQFAELLLNFLEQERNDPDAKGRPILFICHSLGGIVVKKALAFAHARSRYYQEILQDVKGIVFMGVPHRGASIARLGGFFAAVLKGAMAGRNTNADLVRLLEKDSQPLEDISEEVTDRLSTLEIYTFFETESYLDKVIVSEDSARLGIPNEKTFRTNANHRTICKFASAESQAFKLVGRAIKALVDKIIALNGLTNVERQAIAQPAQPVLRFTTEARGASTVPRALLHVIEELNMLDRGVSDLVKWACINYPPARLVRGTGLVDIAHELNQIESLSRERMAVDHGDRQFVFDYLELSWLLKYWSVAETLISQWLVGDHLPTGPDYIVFFGRLDRLTTSYQDCALRLPPLLEAAVRGNQLSLTMLDTTEDNMMHLDHIVDICREKRSVARRIERWPAIRLRLDTMSASA